MRVSKEEFLNTFSLTMHVMTIDVGGGATGFLSETVGLNWDLRGFETSRERRPGQSGVEFWSAAAVVLATDDWA